MGNTPTETVTVATSSGGVGVLPGWDEGDLIQVRENGAIVYDGISIGEFDAEEQRLILNLGWMRMAGVKLTVEGDPKSDKRRIVLARPTEVKRLEGGDQESLPL